MRNSSPSHTTHFLAVAARVAALGVLALAWFTFAPSQLGGRATYVITDGISMQPHFHGGDLAIVRPTSDYHVGEIVAYHNHQLGRIVLHRIVAIAGGRYVFKGDNNDFQDFEHPTKSQLIGALWVHIPGFTTRFGFLRSPWLIAALVAFAVLLFGGNAFRVERRRRRRRAKVEAPHKVPGEWRELLQLAAFVAAVPLGVFCLIAYTHKTSAVTTQSEAYKQSARFTYAARVPVGPVYPTGVAQTGAPLFLALSHRLAVNLDYRFSLKTPHSLSGKASLDAVIESTSGWQRVLPIATRRSFEGNGVTLHGFLDLKQLAKLIEQVELSTQVSGTYTLLLRPHIHVSGALGKTRFADSFGQSLLFDFGSGELHAQTSATNVFAPTKTGSITVHHPSAATLRIFVFPVSVTALRTFADFGLLACLAVLTGLGLTSGTRMPRDEIASRYGRFLVPVERIEWDHAKQIIDVPDMDTLVKIAVRYDRMVMAAGRSEYCVADDGVLYRYRLSSRPLLEVVRNASTTRGSKAVPDAPWT